MHEDLPRHDDHAHLGGARERGLERHDREDRRALAHHGLIAMGGIPEERHESCLDESRVDED